MPKMPGRPKVYTRVDESLLKNIPRELQEIPQWVCWELRPRRNEKPAKCPMSPLNFGQDSRVNDPTTWGTFDQAMGCFLGHKQLAGVGFVFADTDNFTGIDLDDCRDPDTGMLSDQAQTIAFTFNSYTEVSPSGTGIKIFICGTSPGDRQRQNNIEIYSCDHYFTVTGNRISEWPATIESRQKELTDFYRKLFGKIEEQKRVALPEDDALLIAVRAIPDDTLLAKAVRSKKFKRLWEGQFGKSHSDADMALCHDLAYWTRCDKERMNTLFRRSALMREKWERDDYRRATIDKACAECLEMYDPESERDELPIHNDISNTGILTQLVDGEFLYVKEWKEWLRWTTVYWKRNQANELRHEAAARVSADLVRRAHRLPLDRQTAEIKWAIQSGESSRASSMEGFARAEMVIEAKKLDAETMLLACANGIVDLRTGELREGRSSDYLTRATSVAFVSEARCPRFEAFLAEIMQGSREWVEYLWRMIGYCLTGETSEHVFFMLHGDGLNGKSTLVDVLHALLGEYVQMTRFSTFLTKNKPQSGANDDIAHMVGARVVVALEADEASRLDSAIVKNLTGQDTVRARFLYGNEFEFKPRLKLFLVSNYVPRIDDTSNAIWRRVHYIPFRYKVPEDKVDKGLSLKLYGELEGILAKAVAACMRWQREKSLAYPEEGKKETAALRDDSDVIGQALKDIAVTGKNSEVTHKNLYSAITQWHHENGHQYVPKSHAIIKDMRRRGFKEYRGGPNLLFWKGIGLRETRYVEQEELTL
jgi:putative DNA primase/helicase